MGWWNLDPLVAVRIYTRIRVTCVPVRCGVTQTRSVCVADRGFCQRFDTTRQSAVRRGDQNRVPSPSRKRDGSRLPLILMNEVRGFCK